MIKELQTNHLDPTVYADGVHGFMDYFRLHPKNPQLHFLEEILEHFAKIPYENISKIMKLNQAWDSHNKLRLPEEVIESHVSFKLGGTCFSLTFFLQCILTLHGFTCYPVMADMRAGRNFHCCLIVMLDSLKYLVDPGYLLTRPMAINPQKPRLFRSEFTGVELRYDTQSEKYDLFTFTKNEIKWRYRFQDRCVAPEEFLQHWLASFQWNSMHGICLTKVMDGGLIYIHKNFMRETTFAGKRNYHIKKNYHATINDIFGIEKEIIEQAEVALEENLEMERGLGLWVPKNKIGITKN
ncbi:MAG: arylamine N-acetyltransferase [bacterium]